MEKILEKNLLILASAGSGKTYQLCNRVIGLVAKGAEPEKIVALTFTRKAAGEFADNLLTKLAEAKEDGGKAADLREKLCLPDADFGDVLERVVRALPRFMLGTMDGFFAKVVRGFQYELGLTGGRFDLLQGPRGEAMLDGILATLLGESLEAGNADEFLHAFRRASYGKETQRVVDGLREFVRRWHGRFRTSAALEWGPESLLNGVRLEDWEEQKSGLAAGVLRGLGDITYTDKRQQAALEKAVEALVEHTIGSGSLSKGSALLTGILEAAAKDDGPLEARFYKEFAIGGLAGANLRNLVRLAARCEMAAALRRTAAVREIVAVYDARCERQLRRRGLLAFDDVKLLMGAWATDEEARLSREAVDFRLDARYEHWLLDEFQDTSRAEWTGLFPLLDEAATGDAGTLFIVGDRKQAIYAWRGGEVGLFDEVIARYGDGIGQASMSESHRSSPEVLALVNCICGDATTIRELFGEAAADLWEWPDHVSASRLAGPETRGEARVEVVEGKWPERLERLGELLKELGAGRRKMTCGVLVRSNAKVREVADYLRSVELDVIEEGCREPAKDNLVGIAIANLLRWLTDPSDAYSREVVGMSPFAAVLRERHGESWARIWEKLTARAAEVGFAGMVEEIVESCWAEWSDFGRRRAGDLIAALAELDAQGGATPREAADWVERLKVSQNPGVAAVQVMTIHKAKGLGFDVVVLPDIPNDKVPSAQYFDVAEGEGWLSETPPQWARAVIPEMREAEERWSIRQRYESFCMLYVALTRSKRGLYVLLESPAASQAADKASLAQWVVTAVDSDGTPGVPYREGRADWVENVPVLETEAVPHENVVLTAAVPRRERTTPSGAKKKSGVAIAHSAAGMRFGTEVHEAFERVGWLDEETPRFPKTDGAAAVRKILEQPRVSERLQRGGREIELHREQSVEAVIDGVWLSGTIDRLHLHRDPAGKVTRVEVIDFKTDALDDLADLARRYGGQMDAYRQVMQLAYPGAEVECVLLSTRCGDWITV